AGTAAIGNGIDGVGIGNAGGSASNNTIGGTTTGARNIISGNSIRGIELYDALNTVVEGNYIGTDVNGSLAVPNGSDGVLVYKGSTGNTIGGTASGAANLISGNGWIGVQIDSSGTGPGVVTSNNVVLGNTIGLNAAGDAALA